MSEQQSNNDIQVLKDAYWYKDAIIYQLHVKAFFDSNNDGIGDFKGLTSKLDYIQDLGVNTIWLLPFYPSPLKDDGYDIADYRSVNPNYGTIDDFREFVTEAHRRGLRVITELVINHTSDQHPWFQAARNAPAGSPERDFYVWSDDDKKYPGTRIIFNDTETSNWAWDPVAKQYYWHRFFSHQPDLNFDNPAVLEEVIDIMYFWLDMGVDGLRLDAIPYLIEREGTSNENNPETHQIIRKIRAALDARYPDRMLLGEANMWPEDVLAYFGDDGNGRGNECHMAFHFPLMPRMYMAVAQEDRHPIVDIMRQTPEIPEGCQWATFLRNHDELTLEMVTDRERDYMWNFYAADPRARINFGIRRRLAPLMENDRRRIELLNSLLMSMPGTPVVYYGDEIGMGDNIHLGDRNGVRTPMQWSPDRNGGFSLADPAALYQAVIMDPVYGYQGLNVEAQRGTRNSLFNWTRQLITVTKEHKAFNRGTLRMLPARNRKIFAYLREFEDEVILCVANLARSPQPCELDLKEMNGYHPIELLGKSPFPRIGELPYFLTLPAYGFYWFKLNKESTGIDEEPLPELMTLVIPNGWDSVFSGPQRKMMEEQVIPAYLMKERWFAGKGGNTPPKVEIVHWFDTESGRKVVLINVTAAGEEKPRFYTMAWNIMWETMQNDPMSSHRDCALVRVRKNASVGILYESFHEQELVCDLVQHVAKGSSFKGLQEDIHLELSATPAFPDIDVCGLPVTPVSHEQSNTSLSIGDAMIMKIIRQPRIGINPEAEVSQFLTENAKDAHSPALYGTLAVKGLSHEPLIIGVVQEKIPNQGDGWHVTLEYLERFIEEHSLRSEPQTESIAPEEEHGFYLALAKQLGRRTAELHQAFAQPTGQPEFDPEPIDGFDREAWLDGLSVVAERAFISIENAMMHLAPERQALAREALAQRPKVETMIRSLLPRQFKTRKTRVHGDYHLGQVLVAKNDFYIIDFEGEPTRSLKERRRKTSPLKDVAGMLRSFDYAAAAALRDVKQAFADKPEKLQPVLAEWRNATCEAFWNSYLETLAPAENDKQEMLQLRDFFLLEKVLYEIVYESHARPNWIDIPIQGFISLLGGRYEQKHAPEKRNAAVEQNA